MDLHIHMPPGNKKLLVHGGAEIGLARKQGRDRQHVFVQGNEVS